MKCSIKDFFSNCGQIPRKLQKKALMEKFIFCAVKPLAKNLLRVYISLVYSTYFVLSFYLYGCKICFLMLKSSCYFLEK